MLPLSHEHIRSSYNWWWHASHTQHLGDQERTWDWCSSNWATCRISNLLTPVCAAETPASFLQTHHKASNAPVNTARSKEKSNCATIDFTIFWRIATTSLLSGKGACTSLHSRAAWFQKRNCECVTRQSVHQAFTMHEKLIQGSHCGWPTKFHDFSRFSKFFPGIFFFLVGFVYSFSKTNKVKCSNFFTKKKLLAKKIIFFQRNLQINVFCRKFWIITWFWEGYVSKLYRTIDLLLELDLFFARCFFYWGSWAFSGWGQIFFPGFSIFFQVFVPKPPVLPGFPGLALFFQVLQVFQVRWEPCNRWGDPRCTAFWRAQTFAAHKSFAVH